MADRPRGGPDDEFPRVAIDAFVRVLGPDQEGREYVFRTRDLSPGGLFLYTRVGHLYPFRVGAALSVELYDFDRAVDFKAVVVRVVEPAKRLQNRRLVVHRAGIVGHLCKRAIQPFERLFRPPQRVQCAASVDRTENVSRVPCEDFVIAFQRLVVPLEL